jgi:hypothetical protein
MSKRNEYPENRTIIARLNAVFEAQASSRSVLGNILHFKDELSLPPVVVKQIEDALEKCELATQAIAGLEEVDAR